jgi:hypothetical protein
VRIEEAKSAGAVVDENSDRGGAAAAARGGLGPGAELDKARSAWEPICHASMGEHPAAQSASSLILHRDLALTTGRLGGLAVRWRRALASLTLHQELEADPPGSPEMADPQMAQIRWHRTRFSLLLLA